MGCEWVKGSVARVWRHRVLGWVVSGAIVAGAARATVVAPGTPTTAVPDPLLLTLQDGQFLLPVEVSGASGLQEWTFDLAFDPNVVQVVDPGDGSSGIFGAQFAAGDLDTLSFILAGFVFNDQGLVDDVAGFYPGLFDGVTGDGVLAWILFETIDGRQGQDPGFTVPTAPPPSVPEPGTLALLAPALVLVAAARLRRARHAASH